MSSGFVEIQVKGFKEMNELFKRLPQAVGQKVLRQSLLKASQPLLAEVKSRTPVQRTGGGNKRTGGELYQSMKSRVGRSPDAETARVIVGTKLHYANFVEFGTEHQPAQHFMRSAFYTKVDKVIGTFTSECSQHLDDALDSEALRRQAK